MKYKIHTTLIIISCIPLFLSSLLLGCIGMAHYMGSDLLAKAVSGNINNGYLAFFCCLGVLGISIIIPSVVVLAKYADKADKFDEETQKLMEARDRYDVAAAKLIAKSLVS